MTKTLTEQVLNLQKMVEDECSRRCELERKLDIATKALKRIFYERDERAVGDYLWIASNALKEMEEA